MLLSLTARLIPALLLALSHTAHSTDPNDPSTLTPTQLLVDADAALAQNPSHAISLYSQLLAQHDPTHPTALYKRAAAYLILGQTKNALEDLSTLIDHKSEFAPAYYERARVHSKHGRWEDALTDLTGYTERVKEDKELAKAKEFNDTLNEAKRNAEGAWDDEANARYGNCLAKVKSAVKVASADTTLHTLHAKCALLSVASSDKASAPELLQQAAAAYSRAAAMDPSATVTHLNAAQILFYYLNRPENAMQHLKACLRNDPEHKECKAAHRVIKKLVKKIDKAKEDFAQKRWIMVTKGVVGTEDGLLDAFHAEADKAEAVLFADVVKDKADFKVEHRALVVDMSELVCRAYSELKLPDKTIKWCETHLEHRPDSFEALLARGDAYLVKERVDDALRDLKKASEINRNDRRVNERLHRAQRLQKMANKRDYYKILGVSRDASEREIKRAYRKLAKEWHPDRYNGDLSKEEVLAKMSEINLANEVLSNPEKRQQYDEAGIDPNDPGGQQGGHPFYGSPFQSGGFHFDFDDFDFGSGGKPFEFHF